MKRKNYQKLFVSFLKKKRVYQKFHYQLRNYSRCLSIYELYTYPHLWWISLGVDLDARNRKMPSRQYLFWKKMNEEWQSIVWSDLGLRLNLFNKNQWMVK